MVVRKRFDGALLRDKLGRLTYSSNEAGELTRLHYNIFDSVREVIKYRPAPHVVRFDPLGRVIDTTLIYFDQ